jgi:hypothetical protein
LRVSLCFRLELTESYVHRDLATNGNWIDTNSTQSDPDLVLAGPPGITGFRFIDTGAPPQYQSNLLWALVNWWNLYRATLDTALLPDLYAVLRGCVNHHAHIAVKGSDGIYHMPAMRSPEYPSPSVSPDTNYELALFKWGLRTLRKICGLLECEEPRAAHFKDIEDNLADFPIDETQPIGHGRGLKISSDILVNMSHRHYSHLLPCWNTGLLSWDEPAERKTCLESLDNWHGGCNGGACMLGPASKCDPWNDMTWEWDGFSYPASSSFNTRAGRAAAAWGNLSLMLNTVWPKSQLKWNCPGPTKDGKNGKPGSGGDTHCIGASMQPNTFQVGACT